jgi:hypothetical protein
MQAIEMEIRNEFPTFDFIEVEDTTIPPGFTFVDTYFVFNVRMNLLKKARIMARGIMTEPTKDDTFASVVSRETFKLFFHVTTLNNLNFLSYIQNVNLPASNKENV